MMINHRQHDGKLEKNHTKMKGDMDSDDRTSEFDDESMCSRSIDEFSIGSDDKDTKGLS